MSKANSADVKAIIGNASSGVVTIERRKGRDRRAGADRRNCSIPVLLDRRGGDDRRSGFDRRAKGLEPLEARSLFSAVSFEAGILMIRGDESSANEITVNLKKNQIVAQVGDQSIARSATDVRFIRVIGGDQADTITVDPRITVSVGVQAGAGNDTVLTGGGSDLVHGGNGNDWIETGAGRDSIRGGNGRDTIIAGAGHDMVWGGNGSDSLIGNAGNDRMNGESGDDKLRGGEGKDRLDAGPGRNLLRGDVGNDTIVAQSGDDVKGNGGADKITTKVNNSGNNNGNNETTLPENITFTLMNADNDKPIAGYENLKSGATLDLSKLPTKNLNIRANVPTGFKGSIQFSLNGKVVGVEGMAPYALAGDSGGNFKSWTPAKGAQQLSATAFTQSGARGEAGAPIKVNFNVVDTTNSNNTGGNTGGSTGGTGNTGNSGGAVSGNENPNPNAAAPIAKISALSTEIDAGHTIHLNALRSTIYSGSQLSAKFEWDFGDTGSKFNKLVGFNAAHVYTKPGQYTVKLRITDNTGKTDTVTQLITVNESSRRVYYVSADGNDSNSGLSPAAAIRSWDRVRQLTADNTEFRFRAGDTFSVTAEVSVSESNVLFGMYGNGDRPTLKWTSSGGPTFKKFFDLTSSSRDVTVRDLSFDSIFTNHTEKNGVPDVARPAGTNFAAINCEIGNISYFVNNEAEPTGVLVQENVSASKQGLRAYLSYVVGTDHVIIGNSVANSTREHCIRADGGERVLIAYNDLTNVAEGKPGDTTDIMKQTITVHWGNDYYIYGNNTHGGRVEIGPLGEADGLKPRNIGQRLNRVVIDSNDFDFGKYQRLEIDHGTSGVMIRNNRMTVPSGSGISVSATAKYTNWPQYGERNVTNVWITSDNDITAPNRISIGRGSVNVNIADPIALAA